MRIALAGNPNSGKTTMYNVITGGKEKVGNWAGVTVERKERLIRRRYTSGKAGIIAIDLPGAYSISPFTSEESITSSFIKNERPDVIINIVDATNLSRSLFFTTQLLEIGIPVVIALNKTDVNEKRETFIDTEALSALLNCPVIETASTSGRGLDKLVSMAISLAGGVQTAPYSDSAVPLTPAESRESDRERYRFVDGVVSNVERRNPALIEHPVQDKVDRILTNKWLGIPIFALVMFAVFWLSQAGPGVWLADLFVGVLERGKELVSGLVGTESVWSFILVDGIIGGVIAVIGFLPLVMVMYFLIALLEDSGYMARATVVLDPIFKKVGLSGKSAIPFIIGTGCAIPGVMSCRTIRNERERRATAMLAPFMPCGAKLPVIALFAGVFFGDNPWVGTLMYFVGIVVILIGALLINLITGNRKKKNFFIMELPEYKVPNFLRAVSSTLERGWAYIVKAGTVILVCNFAIHLMQNFGWDFRAVSDAEDSILATIATPFAYVIAPVVGVVAWQLAAAAIVGFIAKENVVGSLAVSYGISNLIDTEQFVIIDGAAVEIASVFGITSVAALAYLMFNLFSPPCFAAIGAMNAEIGNKKWFFSGIALQLAVGFSIGHLVYFFGTLITGGVFPTPWAPVLGWSVFALIVAVILILVLRRNAQLKRKTENKEKSEVK